MRYWPDPGLSIVVDGREVTNVGETSTGDFIIRQFEVEEDPVSVVFVIKGNLLSPDLRMPCVDLFFRTCLMLANIYFFKSRNCVSIRYSFCFKDN